MSTVVDFYKNRRRIKIVPRGLVAPANFMSEIKAIVEFAEEVLGDNGKIGLAKLSKREYEKLYPIHEKLKNYNGSGKISLRVYYFKFLNEMIDNILSEEVSKATKTSMEHHAKVALTILKGILEKYI